MKTKEIKDAIFPIITFGFGVLIGVMVMFPKIFSYSQASSILSTKGEMEIIGNVLYYAPNNNVLSNSELEALVKFEGIYQIRINSANSEMVFN